MSDREVFRWATTSARLLAGTVASVAAVALVVTGVSLPWPSLERLPAEAVVTPGAAATTIACSGDLLLAGRDLADASRLVPMASQSVIQGVAAGSPEPTAEILAVTDTDLSGPRALTVAPHDDERSDIAASGSATVDDAELAGYAASACRPPLIEQWLVGGSAATGAADLVLVSNPGTVAATVQLTVFGAGGPVTPPGGSDLVVPARSQRVVALAGIALGESSPVIRVTATGAPVQAAIQASMQRVLDPLGVDQVGSIAVPATTQVIPGIDVTTPPGVIGASETATLVRVLSPGVAASATITVRSVGVRDASLPAVTVPLTAGVPTEVDLGGLPVGSYTVDVESDAGVVAAVWQSTGSGAGTDFAWYTSSPIIDAPSLFAVPRGPAARLTVVNPSDEVADVTLTTADGSPSGTLTIAAGASADLTLRTGEVYLLDSGGSPVRAAVSQFSGSALAGFPVWPRDAASPPITVYP